MGSGSFQLLGASVLTDFYNVQLSTIYTPERRIYDPQLSVRSDEEIQDKMRRDAVIDQALTYRKHLIAGHDLLVPAATEDQDDVMYASIIEQLLKKMRRRTMGMYNLCEAIPRGSAYSAIQGERKPVRIKGLNTTLNWWYPTELRDIGRNRFRQMSRLIKNEQTGENEKRVLWEMWSVDDIQWRVVEHPEWLIKHIYEDTEESLHYGRGLYESLYFYYYAKSLTMQHWLQGADRFANGIMTVAIDGFREAATAKDTQSTVRKYLEALSRHRTQHVLAYDKNDTFEIKTGGMEGANICQLLVSYLDSAMKMHILGANLPNPNEGGSYASDRVKERSTQALVSFDRQLLEETLTYDLISAIIRYNMRNFEQLNLLGRDTPELQIIDEEFQDTKEDVEILKIAWDMGLPLKKSEVYKTFKKSMPDENDDVIVRETTMPTGNPFEPPALRGMSDKLNYLLKKNGNGSKRVLTTEF